MSRVADLQRIIEYNKDLDDVLTTFNLAHIRMYIGSERPYEVHLGPGRPSLLVTLVPLPEKQVRLIIMPIGMIKATSIQVIPEILLKQKLMRFFKEIA